MTTSPPSPDSPRSYVYDDSVRTSSADKTAKKTQRAMSHSWPKFDNDHHWMENMQEWSSDQKSLNDRNWKIIKTINIICIIGLIISIVWIAKIYLKK